MTGQLYLANHPARFWKIGLRPEPEPAEWALAAASAARLLPENARSRGTAIPDLLEMTLGEGQFGPDHWRLSRARRLYYQVKPALPAGLIRRLRRVHRRTVDAGGEFALGWPIEDRYPRFLWETVGRLLASRGVTEVPFMSFWPEGRRSALVLTHDIETAAGQAFVPVLAALEERLGFRSSFNFVAERYPLDGGLIRDLSNRGFEVGVHGLKHDGHLFRSREEFERRARKINGHLRGLGAVGFRAPLTHREPEWMQSLNVEYDLSFFDTDPYEPIPGGTMSIWPFQLGRFVELPYTLPQDFTLFQVVRESSPRLWLEKTAFLARFFGMALVNTHPDYLKEEGRLDTYSAFLEEMRYIDGYWAALPRDVARWWRLRSVAKDASQLAGAAEGVIRCDELGEVQVVPPRRSAGEGESWGGRATTHSEGPANLVSASPHVPGAAVQSALSIPREAPYRTLQGGHG